MSDRMQLQTQQDTPMHVFRDTRTGTPPYIGDFPPSWIPERPELNFIIPTPPRDIEYAPSWMKPFERSVISGKIVEIRGPEWRISHSGDKIVASIDIPGTKGSDVTVDIENGSIIVTARRSDTGIKSTYVQSIGNQYDPSGAEATLERGVLKVILKRSTEKVSHRIFVTEK